MSVCMYIVIALVYDICIIIIFAKDTATNNVKCIANVEMLQYELV